MSEKVKVWREVDEVVKASSVPKKKKDIYKIMTSIPKHDKRRG